MRVELCETEEEATMDAAATARRLKSMTRAYVDHARVETMGARGEASACAGALRVLGLAGSLLTSVEDVAIVFLCRSRPRVPVVRLADIYLNLS